MECKLCESLKTRVRPEADWRAEHKDHGGLSVVPAEHPSGDWAWLICECGAKYLTIRESDES